MKIKIKEGMTFRYHSIDLPTYTIESVNKETGQCKITWRYGDVSNSVACDTSQSLHKIENAFKVGTWVMITPGTSAKKLYQKVLCIKRI